MSSDLKILFPSDAHDNRDKALPSLLVTVGRVRPEIVDAEQKKHRVRVVQARVQHYVDGSLGDTYERAKTRHLRPIAGTTYLHWAVVLKKAAGLSPTRARLTVEAFEKGNNEPIASDYVNLWLRPRGSHADPTIDWPDMEDYEITGDELSYFVTWGASDLPMTAVKLGPADASNIEWYEADDFWWATFSPGTAPGSGNHILQVSNAEAPKSRRIVVA